MNTGYQSSAQRNSARQTLDELKEAKENGLYSDSDRRLERDPLYWVGRLSQAVVNLLDAAEPATVAEYDETIKAAFTGRSRLLGETSELLPAPEGLCGARHKETRAACHRPAGHRADYHRNWAEDCSWPAAAAVTSPVPTRAEHILPGGYTLPASDVAAAPVPYALSHASQVPAPEAAR